MEENGKNIIMQPQLQNLIYVVQNKQVMLDSDLAALYNVETKRLNEAVKRNSARFPQEFCFQLTEEEYQNLKLQISASNNDDFLRPQFASSKSVANTAKRGGRRYLPYVFTEQGIAMLSAVLRSDTAVKVSINIMNAFVEMRRFIASNAMLFERISSVELRQLEYQRQTDEKLGQIFEYIANHREETQKVFFEGQIYDAFSLLAALIAKADKEIILIDGYVDIKTLNLLAKKKSGVDAVIYTNPKTMLSKTDIANFNSQYPLLQIKYSTAFHDRFLILDGAAAYHIGASLKDAGKKCFGINIINDDNIVKAILNTLAKA